MTAQVAGIITVFALCFGAYWAIKLPPSGGEWRHWKS